MKHMNSKKSGNFLFIPIIFILSFSIFFSVILSGCAGIQSSLSWGTPSTDKVTLYNYQQGTTGLQMVFLVNMPPEKVMIGDKFNFGIKLKNSGAYDIKSGEGELTINPDPTVFSIDDNKLKQSFGLYGRSQYAKDGEETQMFFPAMAKCFQQRQGYKRNLSQAIVAIACYKYQTKTSVDICFDPTKDLPNVGTEKICDQQTLSAFGGQGAPIAITKVSPEIVPYKDKIQAMVTIELQKLGDGEVYLWEGKLGCDEAKKQNKIKVDVKLREQKMSCKGVPYTLEPDVAEIRQNKAEIRCSVELDKTEGAFMTPLAITADYQFKTKIGKQINIAAPPGEISSDECQRMESVSTTSSS